MTNLTELQNLVDRFHANIDFYKDARNAYNEHSCRIEYIDPLLKLLGWDVANEKGLAPQYREVIAENYSTRTDRPDYTITLRGVPKFFVEAKKPAVDITRDADPAIRPESTAGTQNIVSPFSLILNILQSTTPATLPMKMMDVLWQDTDCTIIPSM